ncbi:MAG: hypothetical protein KBS83_01045, partial [Lachnospiraceae bacterium]|nr:hypothetical protein [Candidatus Equihabitans merdae]
MNHIILVGFIGCGKGAAAKKLGISMALPVFDVDKMIAERMKMGVEEIFAQFGEVYYRALETQTLNHLMLLDNRSIIVLGSGLPTNPANDDYLKKLGKVYYLKSTKAALVKKIQKSKKHDWLKNDDMTDQVSELLKEREAAYLRIADVEVLVDDLSSDEIAEQLAFYDREPEIAPVIKHDEKAAPK